MGQILSKTLFLKVEFQDGDAGSRDGTEPEVLREKGA